MLLPTWQLMCQLAFAPFMSTSPRPMLAFLDEISWVRIRDLCTEFKKKLIDTLPPLAADLEPFEIIVDTANWESDSNRSPMRPQSHLKVQHIKKHIDSKQQTTNNKQNKIVFCMLYFHKYPTVNCRKLFTVLLVNS